MLSRANVQISRGEKQPEIIHDTLFVYSLCVPSGTIDPTMFHKEFQFHHLLNSRVPQRLAVVSLFFSIYTKSLSSVISLLGRWHTTLLLFFCIHHSNCSEHNRAAFLTSLPEWSPIIWNSTLINLKWYNSRQRILTLLELSIVISRLV